MIIDDALPGPGDGLELARELERMGVRCVLVTERALDAFVASDILFGFMTKPLAGQELRLAVGALGAIVDGEAVSTAYLPDGLYVFALGESATIH